MIFTCNEPVNIANASHLLSRGHMFGELHLGEVAFSDGLEQLVFTDVRLVGGPTP
jgi:hypothetical protein